ncbi:MAG: hypothetical protein HQL56_03855 [Magnetococcales bacterium]|nr:hypothetical protein [Magnetococcales bacterium]
MKFLVIAGTTNQEHARFSPELEVLAAGSDFRFLGTGVRHSRTTGKGSRFWFFGELVGARDRAGNLQTLLDPERFIADLIDSRPPEEWDTILEGRFVVLVERHGEFFLRGDRFGKRDVYIQREASGCVFLASDLSLLPIPPAESGFDQMGLAHQLTVYGHRPPKKHTIYQNTSRLGLGEIAWFREGKFHIERAPFQVPASAPFTMADHKTYQEAFLNHLEASGSRDGNVIFLSSGWDSTSILAGLVHIFGARKVRGVIGEMRYSDRSGVANQFEMDRARKFADHYGIRLDVAGLDYAKQGPSLVEQSKEVSLKHHFFNTSCTNHHILARKARETSTTSGEVIFAGEISDGAHNLGFSQYVSIFHPSYAFREYADKMASYLFGPSFLKLLMENRENEDVVYGLFKSRAEAAGVALDAKQADPARRPFRMLIDFFLRNGRMPLWSARNIQILQPDAIDAYTQEMTNHYLADARDVTPETLYGWYIRLYNNFHWQGSTIPTISMAAEQYGFEAHMPFWDGRLQEFFQEMPESWGRGLDLNNTKYPLKKMLAERLNYPMDFQQGPHSYQYDVIHSFSHTVELIYHSALRDTLRTAMSQKVYHNILSDTVFNMPYLDGLAETYLKDELPQGQALADLGSLCWLCLYGWMQ